MPSTGRVSQARLHSIRKATSRTRPTRFTRFRRASGRSSTCWVAAPPRLQQRGKGRWVMTSESVKPDGSSDERMGILERRRIEAEIIKPIYAILKRDLGIERA